MAVIIFRAPAGALAHVPRRQGRERLIFVTGLAAGKPWHVVSVPVQQLKAASAELFLTGFSEAAGYGEVFLRPFQKAERHGAAGERLCKEPRVPKPATEGKHPCDGEGSKRGLALGGDPFAPGWCLVLVCLS